MRDAMPMSGDEYEELYLASVRVPLVLAIFLGLWGLVILVLQALQIEFSSVLRKASGRWRVGLVGGEQSLRRETSVAAHTTPPPTTLTFVLKFTFTHVISPTQSDNGRGAAFSRGSLTADGYSYSG